MSSFELLRASYDFARSRSKPAPLIVLYKTRCRPPSLLLRFNRPLPVWDDTTTQSFAIAATQTALASRARAASTRSFNHTHDDLAAHLLADTTQPTERATSCNYRLRLARRVRSESPFGSHHWAARRAVSLGNCREVHLTGSISQGQPVQPPLSYLPVGRPAGHIIHSAAAAAAAWSPNDNGPSSEQLRPGER